MKWLMALMLLTITFIGSPGTAGLLSKVRYQVGIVQPFVGLACRTQSSAKHIFETWKAVDVETARKVFQVYQVTDECRFFNAYEAFFIEKLDSMQAANFQDVMQAVLLFSIAPSIDSDIIDYLVTWEPLFSGDAI